MGSDDEDEDDEDLVESIGDEESKLDYEPEIQ